MDGLQGHAVEIRRNLVYSEGLGLFESCDIIENLCNWTIYGITKRKQQARTNELLGILDLNTRTPHRVHAIVRSACGRRQHGHGLLTRRESYCWMSV